jgi:tRNA(Ile)-lysidine synthase TilS/MesJ
MAMSSGARTGLSVSVVTSHGRQQLDWREGERLFELLQRSGVPWSAVSIYVRRKAGDEAVLTPCLDAIVSELDAVDVLLYFNRNVNPFIFSLGRFKIVDSDDAASGASEYFYQRLDNAASGTETFLKRLSPEECRTIIADRVADTVRDVLPRGSRLVVGVSGGGDSNALLQALSRLRDHVTVDGVIIKGIPDWDKGVPRARTLCESYDIPLTIMEEGEVKGLLGLPPDSVGLIDRFEREFKGDDFEFLGTLLIRLALFHRARAIGTTYACTGLNLEDLLCENLFRVSNGMAPAAVPARAIGDMTLIFPLWLCPKRILDGCFPKFSLENYDARYPCFSLGRNLYYSVVYAMQSQFPGFMEQWARGLATLSQQDPVTYTYDQQLGFHIERSVPFALRQKFLRMLADAPARA